MKQYTQELGVRNGKDYFLRVVVDPDYNQPDRFAIILFHNTIDSKTGETRTTEIVRIENKAHGQVHMDQEYLPGRPKDFDIDYTFYDAWHELKENWEWYANRYERHHG